MHASNIQVPLLGAYRHTGYDLIVIENGYQKIYTIDFSAENLDTAQIIIKESPAYEITNHNGQEIYWDSQLTEEEININSPEVKELAYDDNALQIFNKIKLEAALTNLMELDYDVFFDKRVCNTATQYWAEKYIPGYQDKSIFEGLNGNFYGKDDDYINASNYEQAKKLEFINKLVNALDEVSAIDDILTNNEPYISEKYLQILQPFLERDFIYNGEDVLINKFLSDVALGGINFAVIAGLTSTINAKYVDIPSIQSSFTAAENNPSPLILDLDGDEKVETTRISNGTYFDHDGNGFAESTGWVGKDDGLLVRDINGNGQIDNGTELFGNNSVLSSGKKAANGFEALKDLDSNNDGVFNSSDTAWNQVKVWKDTNENGIVDEAA